MNDHPRSDPLRKQASFLALAVLCGVSLSSVAAVAAGSLPIDLGWEGPESCARSDDIDRDVRRFLGDATISEALPPITARVSVSENPDASFEVRMVTTSGADTSERALHTETCEEARDLVAFLLALLIDPNARPPSQPAAVADPAPPKTPPPAPPVRSPAARPSSETKPPPRWLLGISASAELGTLPGASVGGELRTGVLVSGWSVEARANAWVPRRAESESVPGAGGEFSLLDASLLGCLRGAPWEGPLLQGCAGPALLFLEGEGYGVQTPDEEDALFAAAAAEAALLVALSSHLSLRSALGVLVPFRRPTFAIHGVGTIHRPSALSARASVGIEAQF